MECGRCGEADGNGGMSVVQQNKQRGWSRRDVVVVNTSWSTHHGQHIMVNTLHSLSQDAYRHMASQGLKFPVTVKTAAGDTMYLHMRYV